MSWIPKFSLKNTFGSITLIWDDAQVSERLVIDERNGRYNNSSPISLSNTIYTKPDKKITFFGQNSSYFRCLNELDEEYIETNYRSNVITNINTDCIQANLNLFSNKQGCVIVLCVLFVCLLIKNAVCTADSCKYVYVEFTVFKLVFFRNINLIILGIKFIAKKPPIFTRLWY